MIYFKKKQSREFLLIILAFSDLMIIEFREINSAPGSEKKLIDFDIVKRYFLF